MPSEQDIWHDMMTAALYSVHSCVVYYDTDNYPHPYLVHWDSREPEPTIDYWLRYNANRFARCEVWPTYKCFMGAYHA